LRKRFIVVAPTVELGGTDTVADSKESVCLFYKGIKHLRMRIFGPLSEENGSIFFIAAVQVRCCRCFRFANLHAPRAGKSKQQENFDNSEPILRNLIKQHSIAHFFCSRREMAT
jgi:hypothetical protein